MFRRGAAHSAKPALAGGSRPKKTRKTTPDGFWEQPALMNLTADTLIVAASLGLAWAAMMAVQRLPFFPLHELVVSTPLVQVQRVQIEQTSRSAVKGNFFTVDLDSARAEFEKLPWVRHAEVRRQWPDGLVLNIEEHKAVAQWRQADGELQLVNSYGEVFSGESSEALPVFAGPEGSAPQVLARFKEVGAALTPISLRPVSIALTARQSWQVRLDNGDVLELGRDDAAKNPLGERLARFAQYYREAASRSQISVAVFDMRYPSGFTLRPLRSDKGNT